MKIGLFDPILRALPFEEMLDYAVSLGVEAVEISVGGYVGSSHCDATRLIADTDARDAFAAAIRDRGLTVSALSCHGNPLHPNETVAQDSTPLGAMPLSLPACLMSPPW